ncbi:hypothetical protein [Pandoraea terrae]|nr:hypothetical protein [Pandoraea terrae]
MTQVVKTEIRASDCTFDVKPNLIQIARSTLTIFLRLSEKDQVRVDSTHRGSKRLLKQIRHFHRERDRTWQCVLGFNQQHHAPRQIDLIAPQRYDFRRSHSGFDSDTNNPTQHWIRVPVHRCEQPGFFSLVANFTVGYFCGGRSLVLPAMGHGALCPWRKNVPKTRNALHSATQSTPKIQAGFCF